ncbi:MAG: hypothetical protein Q8Q62_13435 [Mesorhizobium sp.]|nr:hypothetical protein [Mesorhizobium sp.]
MDWQITTTQDLLDRIVALLLSLADLAERAAGAPEARRRLALAIIRSGGAVTRDAFGLFGDPFNASARGAAGRAASPMAVPGDAPEDALALAMSLRGLALFIAATAKRMPCLLPPMSGNAEATTGDQSLGHRRRDHIPGAIFPPHQWHDTS